MNRNATRGFVLFTAIAVLSPPAAARLSPVFQDTGQISVSVDGDGNNDASIGGLIEVNKPAGATVRKAFLMANSHGRFGTRVINDGDVSLAGVPVSWNISLFNGITDAPEFFHNVFADVTSIVAPVVDPASPGIVPVSVFEVGTDSINGTVLVVIFNDPNQGLDNSVILLFGDQAPGGETFSVQLGALIAADTAKLDFGLGIGHSFQGPNGTPMVNLVDVNGSRLTSSAGGEDDGIADDGALITVGGIGDDNFNPPDPFAPSSGFRTDDELYDLRPPFVSTGGQEIKVFSSNPTDDDNIFFAYFVTSLRAAVVEAEPARKQFRCNSARCNVPITCKLEADLGAQCSHRVAVFVQPPRSNLSSDGDLSADRSAKARRRPKFASGIANVPPGQTAIVRLKLTRTGKRIARMGKKRLNGVMEIRNAAGFIQTTRGIKIRL